MLTKEQNDLLTQTGPGTPGGDLFRRYWQPVALSAELPPGGAPVPVCLLGEDLVLFRTGDGTPGLLGLHCAHRGCDLSYGRLEDGGIRCIYHGWLYDVRGRCLEQPGEPADSTFYERIRQPAYPCHEQAGIIFGYMGPGVPPLFPNFDILNAPDDRRIVTKVHRESNYLQGNEGNIDSVHLSILHNFAPRWKPNPGFDVIELEPTNHGIRNYWIRKLGEKNYIHITTFVMPNIGAFGGGRGEGYSFNWHVPIDDTHHWEYAINFRYEKPDETWLGSGVGHKELGPDYHPLRTMANRYLAGPRGDEDGDLRGCGPLLLRPRRRDGQPAPGVDERAWSY